MKEFIFENGAKETITVIVEPWAIELEIQPNSKVLIKDDQGEILDFEMKYFIKGVIFYCNNSAISVYENDKKIF
ncbi:hypothetical protein A7P53_01710 [Acinetobacter defluvii]|uniref:Uncharacterized protein n=1 Tax=Acinetobacter defluvii TaxID=1871111 RepID=A0A2S2FAT1_9GAMM|nr:hypothetical protein [Acinetobacter defluvii]AWL28074.1 hypothetical protein DJ533_05480 [Acinetobacter defluvii]NNP74220.1 hypothetical protein [Acinetobacter defluvii]